MAALFGIHIGNTSACIAYCKDEDRIEVIANDTGDRLTPTTVQWTPGQCLVGRGAVSEHIRHLNNTIVRNKQVLNDHITDCELNELRQSVPYKIHKNQSSLKYEVIFDGKQHQVHPNEIALAILKKLHAIAETSGRVGNELQAVLTVPQYFSPSSINLLKEVAQRAGFSVLQVIDDISAAILATVPVSVAFSHCLVVKMGGTITEVTVVQIINGMYCIKSSASITGKAGHWITSKLAEFLISEFARQYRGQEITERGKFKLQIEAEKAKLILSIQSVAQCSAESVGGGFDLNCSVSRPRLDNIISGIIPDLTRLIEQTVAASSLEITQLEKVVLCGGTTKIPKIQEVIKRMLPQCEIFGISSTTPDEIIAIGAATQAKYLSKIDIDDLPDTLSVEIPVTSSSITLSANDAEGVEVTNEVIEKSTMVPLNRTFHMPSTGANLTLKISDDKRENVIMLGDHAADAPSSARISINRDGKLALHLPTCDIPA